MNKDLPEILNGSDAERILLEIANGEETAADDTPALADLRVRMRADIEEILRRGQFIELPSEIP